ncbi:ribonuclease P [Candidatus Bathyarchaeota archaeon]|mgnify:CR=1 FL=1|nr:MAG: ribonuclease P [Candidatus Bathyarchaeota archaeon]
MSKKREEARKERAIALRRIRRLFELALQVVHDEPELADRYVEIARRIAMRARVKLPREYKRLVCKRCKRFIVPGLTCRVRLQPRREPHVVITCLRCGGIYRIPIKGRRSRARSERG